MAVKRILIFSTIVVFAVIMYSFIKSLLPSNIDQTLSVSRTAIDLRPPLQPLIVNQSQSLLDNFSPALKNTADNEINSVRDYPRDLKKSISFFEEKLSIEKSNQIYIDEWLQLYPEVSFESMRYLIAKEFLATSKSEAIARQQFVQFDYLFTQYVNLQRAIEALSVGDGSRADLLQRFNKVKTLRRKYLGEDIARIFFLKEEEYVLKEVFSTQ